MEYVVSTDGAVTADRWNDGISTQPPELWSWLANETLANGSAANRTVISMGSLVSLNYSLPTMIIVASVLFVVIVATAFGNLLVALALFRYRYLRTISNYLIGNLALSDFLLATTILPLSTVNECLGHWVFGQAMCNFWLLADVLYCTASIWNLCIIAFDRFTATLYPVWYREKRSTKQAVVYMVLVWIISAAICMPPLLGWNDLAKSYKYDDRRNVYHCILFDTPSYVAYSASGSFYIPFFITFFLYIRIFTVLHRRMRKMRSANKQHQSQQRAQQPNPARPLLNSAPAGRAHRDPDIEMTMNAAPANEGSGNTEELSSKSLFGSDSGPDDDDDDSSLQAKSDNPLVYPTSCSDPEGAGGGGGSGRKDERGACTAPSPPPTTTTTAIISQASESEQENAGHKANSKPDSNKNVCVRVEDPSNSSEQVLLPKNGISGGGGGSGGSSAGGGARGGASAGGASAGGASTRTNNTKVGKLPGPLSLGGKLLLGSGGATVGGGQAKKKKMPSSQKRKFEQREMRATIRMAIIIACFCGMWLGFFTTYFVRGFCPHCMIPRELDALFFWLGYSNSSVNPILYTIFNEEFRKAFQKILGCYRKGGHYGRH